MGTLQCAACLMMVFYPFKHAEPVAGIGFILNLAGAFMDVVVDGLMVQQQRLDPENGSEDLQSLSWAMYGVGGVVGSYVGGVATEAGRTDIVFLIIAGVGFCIACTGITMS